jgi:hypothetical protein
VSRFIGLGSIEQNPDFDTTAPKPLIRGTVSQLTRPDRHHDWSVLLNAAEAARPGLVKMPAKALI